MIANNKLKGVEKLNKQRNRIRILLYGTMLVAIILGLYTQDIAYFLYYNLTIPLMIGLGVATICSISLFLGPPILISRLNKRHKVGEKAFIIYSGINAVAGIIISSLSLIIFIVWCG